MKRKEMRKTIVIGREENGLFERLMQQDEIDYHEHGIRKFETVRRWSALFGDGIVADLKVCSGDIGEPLWCEVVFLRDFGDFCSEVACTDVCDELAGEWRAEVGGKNYVVEVVVN